MSAPRHLEFAHSTLVRPAVSQEEIADLQRVCRTIAEGGGDLAAIAAEIHQASNGLQDLEWRARVFLNAAP